MQKIHKEILTQLDTIRNIQLHQNKEEIKSLPMSNYSLSPYNLNIYSFIILDSIFYHET